MNQFAFTNRLKMFTLGMIALGVIATLVGFLGDATRTWSNLLHNSVFFVGISFILLFVLCAKSLAYSGWQVSFKRIWEAATFFIPVGLIFMLIIWLGAYLGWHHLYHWADAEEVAKDPILKGKAGLLNIPVYLISTLLVGGYWIITARLYRKWSLAQDETGGLNFWKKTKVLAGFFLPIGGYSSVVVITLWIMSIDAHWYSTMFFWYNAASWLCASMAFTILLLIWLKSRGYYQNTNANHFHDLGKYLFGFSIFWTYLWFSQYMLIWYANVGEETVYFHTRQNQYPVLFYANLVLNFVAPFFILMRNSTKRKMGTMAFAAMLVFVGHWIDYFQMIKPGVWETQQHLSHGDEHHDEDHGETSDATIDLNEARAILTSGQENEKEHQEGEHHDDGEHKHDEHKGEEHHDDAEHKDAEHSEDKHHDEAGHDDGHGDEHAAAGGHGDHGHGGGVNFGYQLPGFQEIAMFIGFLGLYLFVLFTFLARAPLTPVKDPYLGETIHHHVI